MASGTLSRDCDGLSSNQRGAVPACGLVQTDTCRILWHDFLLPDCTLADLLPPGTPAATWDDALWQAYGCHVPRLHSVCSDALTVLSALAHMPEDDISDILGTRQLSLLSQYNLSLRSVLSFVFRARDRGVKQGERGGTDVYVCLLISISIIERLLRDIVAAWQRGRDGVTTAVPHVIRDLLQHPDMISCLPAGAVALLHCLIGPPAGMNLRNVLWHGFRRPGKGEEEEMRMQMAGVVAVLLSLADIAEEMPGGCFRVHLADLQADGLGVRWGRITLGNEGERRMWLREVRHLVESSDFIEASCVTAIMSAIQEASCLLLEEEESRDERGVTTEREREKVAEEMEREREEEREGDCGADELGRTVDVLAMGVDRTHYVLACLLPHMEHFLRVRFVAANDFPSALLWPSSTVYYTTMDMFLMPVCEVSSKWLGREEGGSDEKENTENALVRVLPPGLLAALHDLFNHADGPRLRDKVAHLDLDPAALPSWVLHLFLRSFLALAALHQSSTGERWDKWAFDAYYPRFHRASLLQRRMRAARVTVFLLVEHLERVRGEHEDGQEAEEEEDEWREEYLSCLHPGAATMEEEESRLGRLLDELIAYGRTAYDLPLEADDAQEEVREAAHRDDVYPRLRMCLGEDSNGSESLVTVLSMIVSQVEEVGVAVEDKVAETTRAILEGRASQRICVSFAKLVDVLPVFALILRFSLALAEVKLLETGLQRAGQRDAIEVPSWVRLSNKQLRQLLAGLQRMGTKLPKNQWQEGVKVFVSSLPRVLRC